MVWGHVCDICFNVGVCVRVAVVGRDERSRPVAERGHGRHIPVKGAIEFLIGGNVVVLSQCAEHVESLLHLREKSALQLERTGFVRGHNGEYDVVFGGFDRRLACVKFLIVGCHNLDWDLLGRNVSLDGAGAFVVKNVEGWYVALLLELGVYALEGGDHACVVSCFHKSQ